MFFNVFYDANDNILSIGEKSHLTIESTSSPAMVSFSETSLYLNLLQKNFELMTLKLT